MNEANWLTDAVHNHLINIEANYVYTLEMSEQFISIYTLAKQLEEEYGDLAAALDNGDGEECDWETIAYWLRDGQTDEQFVRDRFPDECELFDDVKSRQWTDLDLFEALYISGELDSDEGWEFDDVEESKENSESLPKVNSGIAVCYACEQTYTTQELSEALDIAEGESS